MPVYLWSQNKSSDRWWSEALLAAPSRRLTKSNGSSNRAAKNMLPLKFICWKFLFSCCNQLQYFSLWGSLLCIQMDTDPKIQTQYFFRAFFKKEEKNSFNVIIQLKSILAHKNMNTYCWRFLINLFHCF